MDISGCLSGVERMINLILYLFVSYQFYHSIIQFLTKQQLIYVGDIIVAHDIIIPTPNN